jgi:CheY-like chemotaxis protein
MQIKPKILVADDEPIIADTLATILNQGGFESRAVYSGEQALEVASTFLPDMLVTDVIMANLDGVETAIHMRSLLPKIKILLFSGESTSADLLLQANKRGYEFEILAKPVHPVDLLMKLQKASSDTAFQQAQIESTKDIGRQQWIDIAPIDPQSERIAASSKDN